MIKAIVFDYSGVIAPSYVSSWIRKNFPNDDLKIKKFNEYSIMWDMGEMDYEKYNNLLSEITKIPSEEIWNTFFKHIQPFQGVIELIKILKKNYKIILFSNNFAPNLRKIIKNQNIENLFDEIIISSDYHMVKPQKDFFDLLLSIARIDKSEAIFFDDRIINVDAANKFGIKSFTFVDADTVKKDLSKNNIELNYFF